MAKAKTNPAQILLIGPPTQMERDAADAITPGMLVELNSGGDVIPHNTAGGWSDKWLAVESAITGDDIDHPYLAGEVCLFNACRPGDEVLLTINDGENIAIGDDLESAGNGKVRSVAGEESAGGGGAFMNKVARALQAIDMTDSSGGDPTFKRIRCRII